MSQSFKHVYWIGGSHCTGKSAIAKILAQKYDLQIYHCDEHIDAHIQRAEPDKHRTFKHIQGMNCDELWMRPVEKQVVSELALYGEEWQMILDDIAELPNDKPLIVEGAAILPTKLPQEYQQQAIWIVPTEEFQQQHYSQREWINGALQNCSNPEKAFQNWMQRDAKFAQWVANKAKQNHFEVLTVTGENSIEQNAEQVAYFLGLVFSW